MLRSLGSAVRWGGLLTGAGIAFAGCAESDGVEVGRDGPDGGGGTTAGAAGASGGGSSGVGGSVSVDSGDCSDACSGDDVCVGSMCCPRDRACGDVCCASGDVCSFGKCETPGAECSSAEDCAAGEYCEPLLYMGSGNPDGGACSGGAAPVGRCLSQPPICPAGQEPDPTSGSIDCVTECEFVPTADPFDLELKYQWGMWTGGNSPPTDPPPPYPYDIRNAPIVIQLDDDDCDGQVTSRDIPEIVFTVSPDERSDPNNRAPGNLHAISIVGGQVVEKWSLPGGVYTFGYLAAGNIDGKPGNEIVAPLPSTGHLGAFTIDPFTPGATPTLLWENPAARAANPTIGDLDQDGKPEVVVPDGIFNGADGTLKHGFTDGNGAPLTNAGGEVILADIDGDSFLDVVGPTRAFDRTGKQIATLPPGRTGSFPAVADLDDPPDGKPEIISIDFSGVDPNDMIGGHELFVWRYSATAPSGAELIREGVDLNALFDPTDCPPTQHGSRNGGGPPTIADVSGDGVPDVAVAGGVGYMVIDGKKLLDSQVASSDVFFWGSTTKDCSSAQTGSAVFDFNGDGRAEVLYNDEERFRVYEGSTGNELIPSICNSNATIQEYPVVADVDNDGQADVLLVANGQYFGCGGERQTGLRVFGSKNSSWVRTRRVWNQHSYHITNVEEDGTIPQKELPNWTQPGLNNFRQNKQPGAEFAAPDAVVTLEPKCAGDYGVIATVRNLGAAPLEAGATVELFKGAAPGTSLGTLSTTLRLYPAQAEQLEFALGAAHQDLSSGASTAYAEVTPLAGDQECRTDNNSSGETRLECAVPK